jgi:hypothetical protein
MAPIHNPYNFGVVRRDAIVVQITEAIADLHTLMTDMHLTKNNCTIYISLDDVELIESDLYIEDYLVTYLSLAFNTNPIPNGVGIDIVTRLLNSMIRE